MSDEGMKITDKRMFTPEGELREEYRFLEERAQEGGAEAEEKAEGRPEADARAAERPPEPHLEGPGPRTEPPRDAPPGPGGPGARPSPEVEGFDTERPAGEGPAFFDLLGVLAEPVPFYLGDAQLPTGESGENLEAARFYIDLLEVLREKTAGNLEPREADALEDLLYRLRLRYVQKRR